MIKLSAYNGLHTCLTKQYNYTKHKCNTRYRTNKRRRRKKNTTTKNICFTVLFSKLYITVLITDMFM